jgi:5'(3')-deoxyribonucleotidase
MKDLWEIQAASQLVIGVDHNAMSDVELRTANNDLLLLLNEEVAELQRSAGQYKKHVLDTAPRDKANTLFGVVDVVKTALSIAQLHGLDYEAFERAFLEKTRIVEGRCEGERRMMEGAHVLCVDMDEVISDMEGWYDHIALADHIAESSERDARREQLKHEWYISSRFRDAAPVLGAPEALQRVQSWGWRIVVVTARPQWQYKRLGADTTWWLDKWKVPHDLVLYGKDKVELIHQHLSPARPVAFIEDMERNIRALSAARVNTLLFDRHHNQNVERLPHVTRVYDWSEILNHLESLRAKAS